MSIARISTDSYFETGGKSARFRSKSLFKVLLCADPCEQCHCFVLQSPPWQISSLATLFCCQVRSADQIIFSHRVRGG